MDDADVDELAQSLRDLARAAFQVVFNRWPIRGGQLDRQTAGEFYVIRIAPGFFCFPPHILETIEQFARPDSDKIGKPCVAISARAALRVLSLAAHPDRQP